MPLSAIHFRNLLLVGIGLPAILAVADQCVLQAIDSELSAVSTGVLFSFYAAQIALMSWAVGRYSTPWPLRWIIWLWTMALIDLQLGAVTASIYNQAANCLVTGVLSGQLGALVVWGFLGSGPFVWRIPSLVVVLGVCWNCYDLLVRINQHASWMQLGWSDLLNVEGVTLCILCASLRLCGYALRIPEPDGDALPAKPEAGRSLQFGIRDVLIGTTSLAVLLGIFKAGDLLTFRFLQQLYAGGFLLVATVAIATAANLLVAIWSALGRGRFELRVLVLVLASLAVGSPLAWYAVNIGQPMMRLNRDYRFAHWYGTGYWWIGWMFLTATLLAASLLIFRTLGYRLVRVEKNKFRRSVDAARETKFRGSGSRA